MVRIARIHNDYKEKFGIPRQAGLAAVESCIVMEPAFRNPDAFRGIEQYDYLWLLWEFSEGFASRENEKPDGPGNAQQGPGGNPDVPEIAQSGPGENAAGQEPERPDWSPTVRPPRLGGNVRMGVFATRSPNRPNAIGLSSVKLLRYEEDRALGPVLYVEGADLLDGTPIYDIKPYVPYTDSHADARGGFATEHRNDHLEVVFPAELLAQIPEEKQKGLLEVLAQDLRPSYQEDPDRKYGIRFGKWNIVFAVEKTVLRVHAVEVKE